MGYQATDVSRAVAFYTEQLGFKLDQQNLPAFGQISLGGLKLILSGPGRLALAPCRMAANNRVVLQVNNLAQRVEEMKKAGLRFRNQMEVGPGGKELQIQDPDGNPIELFEPAQHRE